MHWIKLDECFNFVFSRHPTRYYATFFVWRRISFVLHSSRLSNFTRLFDQPFVSRASSLCGRNRLSRSISPGRHAWRHREYSRTAKTITDQALCVTGNLFLGRNTEWETNSELPVCTRYLKLLKSYGSETTNHLGSEASMFFTTRLGTDHCCPHL